MHQRFGVSWDSQFPMTGDNIDNICNYITVGLVDFTCFKGALLIVWRKENIDDKMHVLIGRVVAISVSSSKDRDILHTLVHIIAAKYFIKAI
jgi:hypothetical protein